MTNPILGSEAAPYPAAPNRVAPQPTVPPFARPPVQPAPRRSRRLPLLLSLTGVVVLAGLVTGGVLLFAPAPPNDTSCKLYENAYNQIADAVVVRTIEAASHDFVRSQVVLAPGRIATALDRAEGDVAVEMLASYEAASTYVALIDTADSDDAGTLFFISTSVVAEACKTDGSPVDLHEME